MATVALTDVYLPEPFNQAVQEAAVEKNSFLASGVLRNDPTLDNMATIGGQVGDLPFYLGLANDEPNYSSDNPASASTPANVTSTKMIYRKAMQNKSWSVMDLSRELALSDPLGAIANRVGHYWAVNTQKRVIQSATGIMLDNVANNSNDMVIDISTDDANATSANEISADAVIDAMSTLGDAAGKVTTIAMHSVQYAQLQKQNLITFIPNARGEVNIPTYLGLRVVVDDAMPARTNTGTSPGTDWIYTVMLFSEGAFGYGMGTPAVPSEVDRDPSSGDGGGQEILYSRSTEIIHPYGFSFGSASVAADSATYAELALAANWTRVYAERKNVGVAFLIVN